MSVNSMREVYREELIIPEEVMNNPHIGEKRKSHDNLSDVCSSKRSTLDRISDISSDEQEVIQALLALQPNLQSDGVSLPEEASLIHTQQITSSVAKTDLLLENSTSQAPNNSQATPKALWRPQLDVVSFAAKSKQPEVSSSYIIFAYEDARGRKRGMCTGCNKDTAIKYHFNSTDQMCQRCRRKVTNMGECTKCKAEGRSSYKTITYHCGQKDQMCQNCRGKELSMGICSKCRDEKGDTEQKFIAYRFGTKDQVCGPCRSRLTRIGVCSKCRDEKRDNRLKRIDYHFRKPDQLCSACRMKAKKEMII